MTDYDENVESLENVAQAAMEVLKLFRISPGCIRVPLDETQLARLLILQKALHDAGYEWEQMT